MSESRPLARREPIATFLAASFLQDHVAIIDFALREHGWGLAVRDATLLSPEEGADVLYDALCTLVGLEARVVAYTATYFAERQMAVSGDHVRHTAGRALRRLRGVLALVLGRWRHVEFCRAVRPGDLLGIDQAIAAYVGWLETEARSCWPPSYRPQEG